MTLKYKIIKEHLENLIIHLEPYLPLANFHMVDYFSKDGYEKFIPEKIKSEIKEVGHKKVMNSIFENDYKDLPNLYDYVEKSRHFTLKNCPLVCFTASNFLEQLTEMGCEEVLRLKLNIFMTSKKSHEVDILSCVCAAIKNISGTSHLIDIGDGKGYLSSMLALNYKIPVLGVDVSEINTNGAVERVRKLSKIWNSVVNNNEGNTRNTTKDLYKQVTKYVDENVDFSQLISNVFLEKPDGLGLVGLHTCGNLASSSLRIFSANNEIKTICNVPCCYHFITEGFEQNDARETTNTGFPMSELLQKKEFVIGRSARMIAAQSVERILCNKELPSSSIFYRALFEVLLDRKCGSLSKQQRQVGRFRKQCDNFSEYVCKAMKRLNLDLDISESEISEIYEQYQCRVDELNVFYLIRAMLSPLIESLIMLDRLLYLYEQGHQKCFVVQLFDPVVSPRCYGLIALK